LDDFWKISRNTLRDPGSTGSTGSIVLSNPNCLVIILKSEYPLNFFMEQTVTIIA
tara:strand:+ start:393 stop:557 length:165 start_codon:yes stop_codon:yes gene_type:complete